jgi:hypothetical protein
VLFHSGSFNSAVFGFSFSRLVPAFAFSALRSIRRAAFFCFFSRRAISFCRFLNVSLAITPPFLARSHCYVTRLAFFLSFASCVFACQERGRPAPRPRLLLLPSLPRFHKPILFSLPPPRPITRNQNFSPIFSLLQQLSSPVTMLPKLSPYIPGRLPKRIEADT